MDSESYVSTEIPDDVSVQSLPDDISDNGLPDEPINLHKAIIRLILLNRTFGRGRQTREWRSVQESIIKGYNSNMEQLYYKYICDINCRERKKQTNYPSDFTNSAFGFKLDKVLSDLLKERMIQYCTICANMGSSSAVDQLNDIKRFIEDCVECCEKTGRKVIDPKILNSFDKKEGPKRRHGTKELMEFVNARISGVPKSDEKL